MSSPPRDPPPVAPAPALAPAQPTAPPHSPPPPSRAAVDAKAARRVHQVELVISTVLRIGVTLSLVTIVSGMLLTFVHHPGYAYDPGELTRLVAPGAAFPHSLTDVFFGVGHHLGRAWIGIGLLLLIATPVARVLVSIFAFMYQRDWTFVVITSVVLVLLLTSFVLGQVAA